MEAYPIINYAPEDEAFAFVFTKICTMPDSRSGLIDTMSGRMSIGIRL